METSPSLPSWNGVPLEKLHRVTSANVEGQYPPVSPSKQHTVCVSLPLSHSGCPAPDPPQLQDVWDETYVQMPWSNSIKDQHGGNDQCSRWQLVLRAINERKMNTSEDIERVIMEYNTRHFGSPGWSFDGLHSFFAEVLSEEESRAFFADTLPSMVKLLRMAPKLLTRPLPLLTRGSNASITLSQQQIAALLVNAFFCTFPREGDEFFCTFPREDDEYTTFPREGDDYTTYPTINFNVLFGRSERKPLAQPQKLMCLFNYFRQVVGDPRTGLVTFTRQSVPKDSSPRWSSSKSWLPRLHVSSDGTIEDSGEGMLQVDFANAMVGGGILASGMAQEEIRFATSPELIVSRLFTQCLDHNEVLIVKGVERFSSHSGYRNTFKFTGVYRDTIGLDSSSRRNTSIVAMDALRITPKQDKYASERVDTEKVDKVDQFTREKVDRELDKAYAGFYNGNVGAGGRLQAVATGNWGCGAFGGDPRLKALLQLMAAAEADREVAYFTYGDDKLREDVFGIYSFLIKNRVTIGGIYEAIIGFCTSGRAKEGENLYDYMYEVIGAEINPKYEAYAVDSDVNIL